MVALAQDVFSVEDEQRLAELYAYDANAEGLDPFIRRRNPRLPPPPHLKPLIDVWERTRYEPVRAIIELPPRHAKTTTAIHGFAWRMELDPALHHAYITYADALSLNKSRAVRRLVKEGGLELTSENVHHWENTFGGSFLATGVEGPLTGKGITGVAVVDDPIKNRKEAESKLIRDNIWDWFTDTFWSRLEEIASVLVIMTRWHKDDLVGRLLKGFEDPETGERVVFERIRLPALAEKGDLLGRKPGEALWPDRWPAKKLHGIRSIMGPYGFSSLYQQAPITKGQQLFSDYPSRFKLADWKLDGHRLVIACDPAATESTAADYSVALVMAAKGYAEKMEGWVLEVFRDQVEIPRLVEVLLQMQTKYWGVATAVEAVGAFKSVPQLLRKEDRRLRVLEIQPEGDKWQRAQNVGSAWSEGRIHVPIDAPWAKDLISELTAFTPKADVDDQVDAIAHAFNTLFKARKPRRRGPGVASNPFG